MAYIVKEKLSDKISLITVQSNGINTIAPFAMEKYAQWVQFFEAVYFYGGVFHYVTLLTKVLMPARRGRENSQ